MRAMDQAARRHDPRRAGICPRDVPPLFLVFLVAVLARPLPAVSQPLSGGVSQDVFSSGGSGGSGGRTTYPTGSQSHQPNDAACANPFGCGRGNTGSLGSLGGLGDALGGVLNGIGGLLKGATNTGANPPSRDVYCQQSPGQPMYGPYHGTGTNTPCGPNFQGTPVSPPSSGPVPNPLPWEQPAAAQTAPISLPRSGTYWTTPFVPGGTPTRPTRKVDLRVYPKKATLQTPQGKFDLSYIGIKYGGSYYNIVGMNPRQNMIFVERYAGALEYDVYYEKVGDSKLLEETWTPAN